ncbi:hypothetical protein ACOMHN_066142 [Nucella lapillus]
MKKKKRSDKSSNTNTNTIVIALVVIIVLVTAAAAYVSWHVRRARRMKGHYKPSEAEHNNGTGIAMDKMSTDTFGERLI